MIKLFFFNIIIFSSLSLFAQDKTSTLTVRITKIKEIKGNMHVGVFRSESDFKAKKNQIAKGIYPVDKNEMVVVYKDIPYGTYAIQLFHDVNSNDKVDSTSIGIPLEPFGFSNDIAPGFGQPPFEKCSFVIDTDLKEVAIVLQKYKKKWSVGVAGLYSTSPYKDDDGRFYPIPVISYQGERLSILGPQVFYTAYRQERWNIDLALRLQFNGYSDNDSETFEGMDDRNLTLEGGLRYKWKFYKKWKLEVDAFGDLLMQHKGFHGSLSVARSFSVKRATITPSLGYEWQSDQFVNYYFGVKESEETNNREQYKPGFNSNGFASVTYMQPIKDSWMFMGTLTGKYLGDEITNSPLIEKDYQISILGAFVYQF